MPHPVERAGEIAVVRGAVHRPFRSACSVAEQCLAIVKGFRAGNDAVRLDPHAQQHRLTRNAIGGQLPSGLRVERRLGLDGQAPHALRPGHGANLDTGFVELFGLRPFGQRGVDEILAQNHLGRGYPGQRSQQWDKAIIVEVLKYYISDSGNPVLYSYITKALLKGKTKKEIKETLIKNGWLPETVDDELKRAS